MKQPMNNWPVEKMMRASVLGMANFATWFVNDKARGGRPSDVDCEIHNQFTNRFFTIEFKPTRVVPGGQLKTLAGKAARGDIAMVVVDPTAGKFQETELPQETVLDVGRVDAQRHIEWGPLTVAELNSEIAKFIEEKPV